MTKAKKSFSSEDFPPGMAQKMLNLLESLESLEKDLDPLISKPHHDVLAKFSSLEKSKLGMLEAYTINSLFWVLMKTSKEESDSSLLDDYKIEMMRLREVQGGIAEAEARANRPQSNPQTAIRMIRRGIGNNQKRSKEQGGKKEKRLKSE